eukprot:SAG11_NODE_2005_length_3930_cov_28.915166_4_plen_189_part_00
MRTRTKLPDETVAGLPTYAAPRPRCSHRTNPIESGDFAGLPPGLDDFGTFNGTTADYDWTSRVRPSHERPPPPDLVSAERDACASTSPFAARLRELLSEYPSVRITRQREALRDLGFAKVAAGAARNDFGETRISSRRGTWVVPRYENCIGGPTRKKIREMKNYCPRAVAWGKNRLYVVPDLGTELLL